MPALTNPRHERFAQGLAKGKTQAEAYADAGYKPSEPNASRLTSNEKVQANRAEFNSHTDKTWGNGEELDPKNRVLRLSATMVAELTRRGVLQDPVKLMVWADTDEAIPYRTRPGRLRGTGRMI